VTLRAWLVTSILITALGLPCTAQRSGSFGMRGGSGRIGGFGHFGSGGRGFSSSPPSYGRSSFMPPAFSAPWHSRSMFYPHFPAPQLGYSPQSGRIIRVPESATPLTGRTDALPGTASRSRIVPRPPSASRVSAIPSQHALGSESRGSARKPDMPRNLRVPKPPANRTVQRSARNSTTPSPPTGVSATPSGLSFVSNSQRGWNRQDFAPLTSRFRLPQSFITRTPRGPSLPASFFFPSISVNTFFVGLPFFSSPFFPNTFSFFPRPFFSFFFFTQPFSFFPRPFFPSPFFPFPRPSPFFFSNAPFSASPFFSPRFF
jgi:hypothetical protein